MKPYWSLGMFSNIVNAINKTTNITGDIVLFRVYKGDNIIKIIKSASTDKHIYAVHNSSGLEEHSAHDYEKDNKTCLYKQGRFCYSRLDLKSRLDANLKGNKDKYTIIDYKNHIDIQHKISNIRPSICVIDMIQYQPTKTILQQSFDKLAPGGYIIVTNYIENSNMLSSKATNEFIEANKSKITTSVDAITKCISIIKKQDEALIMETPLTIDATDDSKQSTDLVICCVLRTGGVYNCDYVNALANSIKRNVTVPHEFVCLTNDATGFNSNVDIVIPLKHDFKKWWCKIELFRPDIFSGKRVFFLDLDTVVVDNIDQIVSKNFDFCGLRDFYKLTTLGSGLMAWQHDKYHHVYERFIRNSTYIMNNTPEGDQRWINDNIKSMKYFQDVFGNNVVSYKKDCVKNKLFKLPNNSKIVCFHGVPKPHQIEYAQIKDHWLP